ncbi:MAG: DUF4249 family protein [Bacteroidetes bacterium]|nr:DUF4249 family protein [Bacteroidota bacterium]
MKKILIIITIALLTGILVTSCEKDVFLDVGDVEDLLVVEGYVLKGETPFVLLTNSFPNGQTIDLDSLFYSGNATVKVTDQSGMEVTLARRTANELTTVQKAYLSEQFLLDPIILYFIPVYIDTSNTIMGIENGTYNLSIEYEDKTLTASTTIPPLRPLDSLTYVKKENFDSLYTVFIHLRMTGSGNYVRYLTKRNSEPFFPPGTTGANWSDATFQGAESLTLPIERGYPSILVRDSLGNLPPGVEERPDDISELGAFKLGDTVTVMWNNIDRESYLFWSSIDADGGDTPFSSPVKALTNVTGGLGIFAGYNQSFYTTVIIQ